MKRWRIFRVTRVTIKSTRPWAAQAPGCDLRGGGHATDCHCRLTAEWRTALAHVETELLLAGMRPA